MVTNGQKVLVSPLQLVTLTALVARSEGGAATLQRPLCCRERPLRLRVSRGRVRGNGQANAVFGFPGQGEIWGGAMVMVNNRG